MTKILVNKVYGGDKVVCHPPGEELPWREFIPFLEGGGDFRDIRKNPLKRRQIYIYETEGKKFHIKRINLISSERVKDKVKGVLKRKSPARELAEKTAMLAKIGVGVIYPCYAIEKKALIKKENLFITPYIRCPQLAELLSSGEVALEDKKELFASAVSDLRKMHDARIFHADAHARNIMVKSGKLLWCDLDKTKISRFLISKGGWYRGRRKDCFKLFRAVVKILIQGGLWNSALQNDIIRLFETNYPGYGIMKKIVYRRTAGEFKEFEY